MMKIDSMETTDLDTLYTSAYEELCKGLFVNNVYADCLVCNPEGKFLLLKRIEADQFGSGKWCLPGGKWETDESLSDGALREMREETGLIATEATALPGMTNDDGSHSFYFLVEADGEVTLDPEEHDDYAWVDKSELDQYDLLLDLKDRLTELTKNIPVPTEQPVIKKSADDLLNDGEITIAEYIKYLRQ